MQPLHVWIRSESRGTERRAPVVPADVPQLVAAGVRVTVEESRQRAFTDDEYAAAGATVVGESTWTEAPEDAYVLGIKELPDEPESLRHRHIYFAHAFKGQDDARRTLERFRRGGGRLLDIEYLTGEDGRRVVAFGYWAGYVGAALGVLQLAGTLTAPLAPMAKHELDAELERAGKAGADELLALVTGARGRSGRGAQQALTTAGMPRPGGTGRRPGTCTSRPSSATTCWSTAWSRTPRRPRSWSRRTWTTSAGCGCSPT